MTPRRFRVRGKGLYACVPLLLAIAGCSSSDDDEAPVSPPPHGPVETTRHEGDDGLLAGLGLDGLREPPEFFANPETPTESELRRQAIHANYVALVDESEASGFGTLYGPTDDTVFPGEEHLAFTGEGINRATAMIQVPDDFDPERACIVVAPSSGSRGVYGAVGTGGEWGLRQGCAVAYTDANKGTGAVALDRNTGFGLQLETIELTSDVEVTFRVPTTDNVPESDDDHADAPIPTEEELANWIAGHPDRFAFKHAHSQKNIEKDWGRHTVESVELAFDVLNARYGEGSLTRDDVLVIGASVSNGGAALLRAVEAAEPDLFDGVVVGEPNVNPAASPSPVRIEMPGRPPVADAGLPAYEYFVTAELYAGCATLDPANAGAQFAGLRGDPAPRCAALAAAGLLADGTPEAQGAEASRKLLEGGYLRESLPLLVGYAGIDLFQSLLTTYSNAYTRSSVADSLCGVGMAHVDVTGGATEPSDLPALAVLAAVSNGIPPTGGVQLIAEDAPGGPTPLAGAPSADGALDYNFDVAQCWRGLSRDADDPLRGRLLQGIEEIRASGDLRGVPAIIVHGRSDALIPVNHSSRAYYALNRQVEGDDSDLHYYEITNAQHLDALNPAYAAAGMYYVPIDYYFKRALDLMLEHLRDGTALPPSQVVKATAPDGGNVTPENLPPIDAASTSPIEYEDGRLLIPE